MTALAVRLAFAAAAGKGFWVCSNCGSPYAPPRRPQRGRRNYCPGCQEKGVPKRDAAREYRARKRRNTETTGGE